MLDIRACVVFGGGENEEEANKKEGGGQSGADGCSVLNLNSGARVCANADANVDANMDANASPCKRG